MRAFGISLVIAALLAHAYFFGWENGFGYRGAEDTGFSEGWGFLLGIIAPVLLAGAGLGMAFCRRKP